MIRIFLEDNNTPIQVQDVFIENYEKGGAEKHTELLSFIGGFRGKIELISKFRIVEFDFLL